MTPRPLPWMKPGDLILFDLESLPWPAYLRLVERFFEVRERRLVCLRQQENRVEYQVFNPDGTLDAVLICRQSRRSIDESELWRLNQLMQIHSVRRGLLFSPGAFDSGVYLRASDVNVELYSGNKLRVRVESLRGDQRRQVMDAITAKPRPIQQSS
ncbi:hypothetical protein [Motiliproteus sediminis]|uniref:hypothetical protein n=1 Tax=Motiliproteus sediminis TaxID=1468178 RepID=UPI001AEFD173|nr:hypothetical protein [Motiliproteus sediminis]